MLSPNLLLYLSIVLSGVAVFLIVMVLVAQNKDAEVLSWASGEEPVKSKSPLINFARPFVHQFVLKYVKYFRNPIKDKQIERLLLTSGLNRELNLNEFIAFKLFWSVGFPFFLFVFNFAYDAGLPIVLIVGAGLGGWLFPDIYAKSEKKKREMAIQADLPFFADLLALSTEAGLDFIGAIQKIVDKAQNSVLAEELGVVLKDIKLGSARADALRGLAIRCELMEIVSFTAVLIDADATGASISKVLKDQSEQLRMERFLRAERAGAKASQSILFPIVLFIVPAIFVVIFGPIVISMMSGGN